MKFVDKKNLLIRELNKDYYDFEYSDEIIFDSKRYDDLEIINTETKEVFPYKELLLAISNKGLAYFYPPELFGTVKVIEEYALDKWIFTKDVRAKQLSDNSFQESVITFMKTTTDLLSKLGTMAVEAGNVTVAASNVMNDTLTAFNNFSVGKPQPAQVVNQQPVVGGIQKVNLNIKK